MITIDQFQRASSSRVGTVTAAEPHPNADRLLVLRVDLGSEERQIVAGIRAHYEPETLVGTAGRGGREPRAGDAPRRREPGHAARGVERRARRAGATGRAGRRRARWCDRWMPADARRSSPRGCGATSAGAPVLAGVDLDVEAGELVVAARRERRRQDDAAARARDAAPAERRHAAALRRGRQPAAAGRAPPQIGYVGHESACYPRPDGRENLAVLRRAATASPTPPARVAELLALDRARGRGAPSGARRTRAA